MRGQFGRFVILVNVFGKPPAPPPSGGGGGGGGGGTCFLPDQMVLMANSSLKPISEIEVGDVIQGRWGLNTVRGVERPLLGNRKMVCLNGSCMNTMDHPTWTETGWQVADKSFFEINDWQKEFRLFDDRNGVSWMETYTPCHPDTVSPYKAGETMLAIPGGGFERLETIAVDESLDPRIVLYSLATDGDRTMYVDNYCFSAWANEKELNYLERIGS